MFDITIQGPCAGGKSWFVHHVLIPALREHGYGAEFYDGQETTPGMVLTGPDHKTLTVREITGPCSRPIPFPTERLR